MRGSADRTGSATVLRDPVIERNSTARGQCCRGWLVRSPGACARARRVQQWHDPLLSLRLGGWHRVRHCSATGSGLRARLWSGLPSCTIHRISWKLDIFFPQNQYKINQKPGPPTFQIFVFPPPLHLMKKSFLCNVQLAFVKITSQGIKAQLLTCNTLTLAKNGAEGLRGRNTQ